MMLCPLFSCTDEIIDAAGECVTCNYPDGRIVMACADGEGNLDGTMTDANGSASMFVSEDFNLADFRVTHEGGGATCN